MTKLQRQCIRYTLEKLNASKVMQQNVINAVLEAIKKDETHAEEGRTVYGSCQNPHHMPVNFRVEYDRIARIIWVTPPVLKESAIIRY